MREYRYDTHVHTSEVSPCAQVDAATVVEMYKDAGYDGIVITDHFVDSIIDFVQGCWEDKIDAYLKGYRIAKKHGEKIGLRVLLGIELSFSEYRNNDYLVYGIDEEFLKKNENIHTWGIEKFAAKMKGTGIMIYQAHPFRQGVVPANPKFLDGVEVYNGNPRHESRNELAFEYAAKHSLKKISGSDFHRPEDLAHGGVVLPEAPSNSAEFAALLRAGRIIRLICD